MKISTLFRFIYLFNRLSDEKKGYVIAVIESGIVWEKYYGNKAAEKGIDRNPKTCNGSVFRSGENT